MSKILIAEDEESLRKLLVRQLVRSNYDVTEVSNGEEALSALKSEPFDLVISDMKMPRLDGISLIREANRLEIPVDFVVLTGHGSLEGAVEAFKNGNVIDYLLKPLEDIRMLNRIVAKALEARRLKSENLRLVEELTKMALEDGLTGLLNYRGIHDQLNKKLQQEPATLSLVLLDMDNFKYLNDIYGHPFGDKVLCQITAALRAVTGDFASLGRCGGDEFMMVLPGYSQMEAKELVENVRAYLANQPLETPDNRKIPLALSFGVTDIATVGPQSARLVAGADVALYQSKRRGGNQVTVFSEHPHHPNPDPLIQLTNCLDPFTRKHSEEMTKLAVELARHLGLDEATCNAVEVAGLLHDIGKIAIPEKILMKPGGLTKDEVELSRQHVYYSERITKTLPDLPLILSGVTHHHERWDGCGYPSGLVGNNIPLLGRLLAVADSYSAMISSRPYRIQLSQEEALAEIQKSAGEQFDPIITEALIELVRKQPSSLEGEAKQSHSTLTQLSKAA